MASLKKVEIIWKLAKEHGIIIKDSHALNKIMEEMGILIHYGNGWVTSKKGVGFSIFRGPTLNCNLWREHVVEAIAAYLKEKK